MSINPFSFEIWQIVKWFFVFAFSLYVVFSVVVIKQVSMMNKTLNVHFEKPVTLLAYLHFFFAVGVLIFAFLVL
jgi:hypothetical protein